VIIAASQSPLPSHSQLYQITGTLNSSRSLSLPVNCWSIPVISRRRDFPGGSAADMEHVGRCIFPSCVDDPIGRKRDYWRSTASGLTGIAMWKLAGAVCSIADCWTTRPRTSPSLLLYQPGYPAVHHASCWRTSHSTLTEARPPLRKVHAELCEMPMCR